MSERIGPRVLRAHICGVMQDGLCCALPDGHTGAHRCVIEAETSETMEPKEYRPAVRAVSEAEGLGVLLEQASEHITWLQDELKAECAESDRLRAALEDAKLGRHTLDEIRAINQAAAAFDGVLALSYNDKRTLALKLFEIAGNPVAARTASGEPRNG